MLRLFLALAFVVFALTSAVAARAQDIAVSPGNLIIEVAIKAEVGNYRFQTKMQVAIKNDKKAVMSVDSDDPKSPVKCKLTIHPTLQPGSSTVQLRLAVVIRAGNDVLTRSLDLTTPIGLQGQMKDQRESPHEKLELSWTVNVR